MTEGSRRVGAVEIVPLLDAAFPDDPAIEAFPGATPAIWEQARQRYSGAFAGDRWLLRVRCFVLRSQGETVIVDTGIGPESAPAFAWSRTRGALPGELAGVGVDPADVGTVVITHVHSDHIGWNVAEGTGEPLFSNARYVVNRADWEWMATSDDEDDRAALATVLAPLEKAGVLELSDERRDLTSEVMVVHAPGHTPGHQVVLIDSRDERGVLTGDLVNHPVQLLQPGVNGTSDSDPDRAAATRAALLERIAREDRLAIPTHFPEPFGRFVREAERWGWVPD